MAVVFISFTSADVAVAEDLHARLRTAGHTVFRDRDAVDGIRIGEKWKERLHRELRRADAVLALVSRSSIASSWCAAEVSIADTLGCRLLPVRLEPDLTHPLMEDLQYAEYATDPEHAVDVLLHTLRALRPMADVTDVGGNPFPGLKRFTPDLAPFFHGRAAEVRDLANRLRQSERSGTGVLAVVGPSGCGKSSLLGAGLVHRLTRDDGWLCLPVWEPGSDPVGGLARHLALAGRAQGLARPTARVREALESPRGVSAVVEDLLDLDPGGADRVLLPVDQGEELFTRAGAPAREQLWQLLCDAVAVGPLHVVMTLRSEFLDDLCELPARSRVPIDAFVLAPLASEMLLTVVEAPARVAGLTLEPELAARMAADTGSGEALPLLAFTLRELADGVPPGGCLTAARYEGLGGVRGALARHADAALRTAVARCGVSADEVLASLVRMVTVDEDKRRARRRIRPDRLPDPLRCALGVLVDERLLVTGSDEDGPWVTVAHEAMFTAWQPLVAAIAALTPAIGAARTVEQAAEEWRRAGSPRDYLWGGERLIATRALLAAGGSALDLDDDAAAFLAASQQQAATAADRERRRRRLTTVGLSVLLVMALSVAGLFFVLFRSTESAQRSAVAQQLVSQSSGLMNSDAWTGLRLAIAAEHLQPDHATENVLLRYLHFSAFTAVLPGHHAPVWSSAYSPDGATLATSDADRQIILWDVTDPEHPRPRGAHLVGHAGIVSGVAFSPDGTALASVGADGNLVVWDITDPDRPTRRGSASVAPALARTVRFADPATVLTTTDQGVARFWDVAAPGGPVPVGPPMDGGNGVAWSATFADDGRVLAVSGAGGVLLWDVTDRTRPSRVGPSLVGGPGDVYSVQTDPTRSTLIAAGGADGGTVLWDVADPTQPRRRGQALTGQTGSITAVAFARNELLPGQVWLATASSDRSVAMWNVSDPDRGARFTNTFPAHSGSIATVAINPQGTGMATGSADTSVMLWRLFGPRSADLTVQRGRQPVTPGAALQWVGSTADGRTVATAGDDGSVRLFDVAGLQVRATLRGHSGAVRSGAFARDRPLLATGGDDKTVRLWDVTDPPNAAPVGEPLTGHDGPVRALALTPDGTVLATASTDRTVILWDVRDPARPQRLGAPIEAAVNPTGVTAVAFLPDGRSMVTAGDNGTVTVWDVTAPEAPAVLVSVPDVHRDVVSAIAVSPDGTTLATAGADYRVVLWDASVPAQLHVTGNPIPAHDRALTGVAFLPGGRSLVTSALDGRVNLWDVVDRARPELLGILDATGSVVPQSSTVTSGGLLSVALSDGTLNNVQMVDVDAMRTRAATLACARTDGGLTAEQWTTYAPDLAFEKTCS